MRQDEKDPQELHLATDSHGARDALSSVYREMAQKRQNMFEGVGADYERSEGAVAERG